MSYRLARTYEEAGYKIIESTIEDRNGKKYATAKVNCYRCNGKGEIPYFGHIDQGVCFLCGGKGYFTKECRLYTDEERAKLDAQAERKRERELEKKRAEAEGKRKAWLDKYGISDGNIYIVAGCNTYEIKDMLKELGAKYYSGLNWFFGTQSAPIDNEQFPATAFLYHATIDDLMYWTELGAGPYFKEGALDEMADDIKKIVSVRNKETSTSQWIGEVGDRLRKVKATYLSTKYFEGQWGGSFIYTFSIEGNIAVWFSTAIIDTEIKENDEIEFSGTVKDHKEYNGILQTYFSRCIVKKVGE